MEVSSPPLHQHREDDENSSQSSLASASLDLLSIVHAGWLSKQPLSQRGILPGRFQKRYFILTPEVLCYTPRKLDLESIASAKSKPKADGASSSVFSPGATKKKVRAWPLSEIRTVEVLEDLEQLRITLSDDRVLVLRGSAPAISIWAQKFESIGVASLSVRRVQSALDSYKSAASEKSASAKTVSPSSTKSVVGQIRGWLGGLKPQSPSKEPAAKAETEAGEQKPEPTQKFNLDATSEAEPESAQGAATTTAPIPGSESALSDPAAAAASAAQDTSAMATPPLTTALVLEGSDLTPSVLADIEEEEEEAEEQEQKGAQRESLIVEPQHGTRHNNTGSRSESQPRCGWFFSWCLGEDS